MSYNGSGTFQINSTGQPVVSGTVISSTAFNALTADLATGLSTAITKDGQTATTARIPFAAGINSTLVTDSASTTTGSIITAGGVGIAKALYVGTTANFGGIATYSAQPIFSSLTASSAVATDASKGLVSVTNTGTGNNVLGTGPTVSLPVIDNIKMGYSTTATAAGTTTLTAASNHQQFFTGTLAQTIVLPVTSTLALGLGYSIENNSTGTLTVQSSGLNTIATIPAGVTTLFTCTLITGTTAASWDYDHVGFAALTGTGSVVLATSPTITTPTISQLSSAAATALTLQSAGTTAITVDTSQNVGIGTASPTARLTVASGTNEGAVRVSDNATYYGALARVQATDEVRLGSYGTSQNLTFYTVSSERARINSSGLILMARTTTSSRANTATLQVAMSGSNQAVALENTNATPYGIDIYYSGAAPNSTGSDFIACGDTGANRFIVRSNGGIANFSANNVNLSDRREKTNFAPAKSYLDVICAIPVQTFNYIDQNIEEDAGLTLGVVAQDVQAVAPEMVTESNWGSEEEPKMRLSIYQTDLQYALMKCIQEQQAIITALTTRITALESAP